MNQYECNEYKVRVYKQLGRWTAEVSWAFKTEMSVAGYGFGTKSHRHERRDVAVSKLLNSIERKWGEVSARRCGDFLK